MTLWAALHAHAGAGLNDQSEVGADNGRETVLILTLRLDRQPPSGRVALLGQEVGTDFNGWMGLMTAIDRLTDNAG